MLSEGFRQQRPWPSEGRWPLEDEVIGEGKQIFYLGTSWLRTTPPRVWLKWGHFTLLTLSYNMRLLCCYKPLTWGKYLQESWDKTTKDGTEREGSPQTTQYRREWQTSILDKLHPLSLPILLILQHRHTDNCLFYTQQPEWSYQQLAANIYCLLTRRKHCPEPLTLLISLNPGNNLRH